MRYLKKLSGVYPWLCSAVIHLIIFSIFILTPAVIYYSSGLNNGSSGNALSASPTSYPAVVKPIPINQQSLVHNYTDYLQVEPLIVKPDTQDYLPELLFEDNERPRQVTQSTAHSLARRDDIPSYTQLTNWHKTLNNPGSIQTAPSLKTGLSKNVLPEYPLSARSLGQEGLVVLKARVNKAGEVAEVTIFQSSGYDLLDQSALKRVKEWQFNPATRWGVTVEAEVVVPIRFKLEG